MKMLIYILGIITGIAIGVLIEEILYAKEENQK